MHALICILCQTEYSTAFYTYTECSAYNVSNFWVLFRVKNAISIYAQLSTSTYQEHCNIHTWLYQTFYNTDILPYRINKKKVMGQSTPQKNDIHDILAHCTCDW